MVITQITNLVSQKQKEHINIAQGDVLRITGNGQTHGGQPLNNGESRKVTGFTQDGHILLDNGQIKCNDNKNFTLGYYRTSHASQGKDAHDVFIAQSSISFTASNQKQFYVSASRGIERCFIYTDDKESLKWAASKNADRMSAAEVAAASKDKSGWLATRNAIQRRQLEIYQQSVDNYYRHPSEKETIYESSIKEPGPLDPYSRKNAGTIELSY